MLTYSYKRVLVHGVESREGVVRRMCDGKVCQIKFLPLQWVPAKGKMGTLAVLVYIGQDIEKSA
jgi:hypothetical protein